MSIYNLQPLNGWEKPLPWRVMVSCLRYIGMLKNKIQRSGQT